MKYGDVEVFIDGWVGVYCAELGQGLRAVHNGRPVSVRNRPRSVLSH